MAEEPCRRRLAGAGPLFCCSQLEIMAAAKMDFVACGRIILWQHIFIPFAVYDINAFLVCSKYLTLNITYDYNKNVYCSARRTNRPKQNVVLQYESHVV